LNIEKWILIIVLGLAMIPIGIYTALKPSYNERLETNTTRLFNDTVLRVDVGSEMYFNYTGFTTYDVPGELQDVNITGVVEEGNRALFLFKVIDGIEVEKIESGFPGFNYYWAHWVFGTAHFNFAIYDFDVLQIGVYFIVGNHNSSKAIEVELRDVNLTWTYKILYGEYRPGAPIGLLSIVLGTVLVIIGMRKSKVE